MRPVCLALTTLLACSCSQKSQGPDPRDDQADGEVVEAIGEVTAQRRGEGEPRRLAAKAAVFGDDRIETGAGSSVEIRLFHNQAVLSLDASMSRTLYQTSAWHARRGENGLFDDPTGQTAAAGRHAEPEGAGTRATAAEEAADKPTGVSPVPPPPDIPGEGKGKAVIPGKGPVHATPPDDLLSQVRFSDLTVVDGAPSQEALRALEGRLERAYKSLLRMCYERHLSTNPDASGRVTVEMEVAEDGRVVAAKVKGFDGVLSRCIEEQVHDSELTPLKNETGTPIRVVLRFTATLQPE